MLKYKYAYDEKGNEVNILNVPLEGHLKRIFTCMGCGGQMLAAIGPKRMYFRHKYDEANCDKESYLHKLAKIRIKRKFDDKTRPFNIVLSGPLECDRDCKMFSEMECTVNGFYPSIDLHEYYDTCEEERSYGGFVADLLLTHSQHPDRQPVFIEVCVTHECTEEKKQSGNKIIEIKVSSEDSIEYLVESNWAQSYRFYFTDEDIARNLLFVDFYGFNPKVRKTNFKNIEAEYKGKGVGRFILYPSGKFYSTYVKCFDAKNRYRKSSIMEFNVPWNFWGISSLEVAHYLKRKHNLYIKACSICRYSWVSRHEEGVCHCHFSSDKFEIIEEPGFKALECPRFELKWLKAVHIPEKDMFKDEDVEVIVPYTKA